MYKVTVSPESGITATYYIETDDRLVAIAKAQTYGMRDFKKEYGQVQLYGIEEVQQKGSDLSVLSISKCKGSNYR